MFSGRLAWQALTLGPFLDPGEESRAHESLCLGALSLWHLRAMHICIKYRCYDKHQCCVQMQSPLSTFPFHPSVLAIKNIAALLCPNNFSALKIFLMTFFACSVLRVPGEPYCITAEAALEPGCLGLNFRSISY